MGSITNSTLHRNTPLRSHTDLRSAYAKKVKSGEKKAYKYKPRSKSRAKWFSIFTDDLSRCVITGSRQNVHVHHVFGTENGKKFSERYGFLLPLRADWHDMADYGIHFDRALNVKYKLLCQEYYLEHYGTKEDFIREVGKWWIDESMQISEGSHSKIA